MNLVRLIGAGVQYAESSDGSTGRQPEHSLRWRCRFDIGCSSSIGAAMPVRIVDSEPSESWLECRSSARPRTVKLRRTESGNHLVKPLHFDLLRDCGRHSIDPHESLSLILIQQRVLVMVKSNLEGMKARHLAKHHLNAKHDILLVLVHHAAEVSYCPVCFFVAIYRSFESV